MELENLNCFLIRGLGREVRHWGKFSKLMEKECSFLHCLELPGFGEKVNEVSPRTVRGCVEELRKEFAGLAISAAEKVVQDSLDSEKHNQIIESVLNEANVGNNN